MIDHKKNNFSFYKPYKGEGLINNLINRLPFELHLPGYNFCGPGTKLQKRLARGDSGINPLDEACKEHDIAYSKYKETEQRHIADKILAGKAWERVRSNNASLSERANAWLVTNAMKTKVKFGMGVSNKNKNKKKSIRKNKFSGKKLFRKTLQSVKNVIKKNKPESMPSAINLALKAARSTIKNKRNMVEVPRIIPIPKTGGILPLLPIFAGLSALGALTGGATQVAKAINDAKTAKQQLAENIRHNKQMEAVAMGKGLHLKPYKKGLGLYLSPESRKNF